ncbi:MAG: LapA family protein [Candidatus Aminicenantes bacterium]|nr:LapA family protein [Candidatus Aminicenantes bacterium]
MKPKIIVIIVLVVLFLVIMIQNTEVVDIQLFMWKISMSRIIMISFMMLIGFGLGYLVARLEKSKKK